MQLQTGEPLYQIMLARYYEPSLGRFLSTDPLAAVGKNRRSPQRWNRYVYCLDNPLLYFDPDGMDVTVAPSARQAVVHGYQHSAEFRKQFDAAKSNPDINVTLTRTQTVSKGRAKSDVDVGKMIHRDVSGNETVTYSVTGKVAVPEKDGGSQVMGDKAATLFDHELAHVNNQAKNGSEGKEGSPEHDAGERNAQASEEETKKDMLDPADDVSKDEAEKALIGTEPKTKEK
jgi:RHS repeat-associated protein